MGTGLCFIATALIFIASITFIKDNFPVVTTWVVITFLGLILLWVAGLIPAISLGFVDRWINGDEEN